MTLFCGMGPSFKPIDHVEIKVHNEFREKILLVVHTPRVFNLLLNVYCSVLQNDICILYFMNFSEYIFYKRYI